jgi:hypothetical protein
VNRTTQAGQSDTRLRELYRLTQGYLWGFLAGYLARRWHR